MEKDIGAQFGEFSVETKYEDIPQETLEFTKCLTLKTVAGMLAGSTKPTAQRMARIIRDRKFPAELGAIGRVLKPQSGGSFSKGLFCTCQRPGG